MAFWRPFWKFAKFWMETTCFISETVRDRANHSLFYNPVCLLATKFQLLKISILERSKFPSPVGLQPMKLQLLKILILGSHEPSRSHDLENVNWPLSRKPQEIERNGAIFLTLWIYYLRNYNFWKYRFWSTGLLKVTWPRKHKMAIILLKQWVGRLGRGSSMYR